MALTESAVQNIISNNCWAEECPVHHSRLVLLDIPFINYDGFSQIGQIMVLDVIKNETIALFKELANRSFPISSLLLMDSFKGDDVASMNANNSSAFNGRRIMNTNRWSSHAYGVAIDINPRQNPYLRFNTDENTIKVLPDEALPFVNRTVPKKGWLSPSWICSLNMDLQNGVGDGTISPIITIFRCPGIELTHFFKTLASARTNRFYASIVVKNTFRSGYFWLDLINWWGRFSSNKNVSNCRVDA